MAQKEGIVYRYMKAERSTSTQHSWLLVEPEVDGAAPLPDLVLVDMARYEGRKELGQSCLC